MSGFTEGEWLLIGRMGDRSDAMVVDDCGRVLAVCSAEPSHEVSDKEAFANARLIAQAPHLLKAAKAYRNLLRTMAQTEGEARTFAHLEEIISLVDKE